jgi:NTE family protein
MSESSELVSDTAETDEAGPRPGVGLAVSGGGYRAMLFHLGSFWRLFELGILKELDRISSVSGGSITAAKIGLEWDRLGSAGDFVERVVGPIRDLAGITVDASSIIGGLLLPGSVADRVSAAYARHLFGEATLQDLPDDTRFVINATNVETGTLWRFSKPYMRDYRVGRVDNPMVSLADAVTASSAFPPVLSPFVLAVGADAFSEVMPGLDPGHLDEIALTDGGVYDNLGLETVWKRYRTVLVSDAGSAVPLDPAPPADWARHAKRVFDIIYQQVSTVRRRQVIAAFQAGDRSGAYWGIGTDIAAYQLASALPATHARAMELARTPTRLKALPAAHQERLINWGYAVTDAAIRRHWPPPGGGPEPVFPYPAAGV